MSILLVVAVATEAGIAVLLGTFMAGSQARRNLIWAGCLVVMGVIVIALLLAMSVTSNIDTPRAGLDFNPIRIIKRAWEASDFVPVIQGFVLGSGIALAGGAIIWAMGRRLSWPVGPAMTLLMALSLTGLFIGARSVSPSVWIRGEIVSPNLVAPPGFVLRAYLPHGIYRPTSIAFDSNDRLFIANLDGVVTVVTDTDGDGLGDKTTEFAKKEGLILGIEVSDDGKTVYLAGGGDVLKLTDPDLDGKSNTSVRIIEGLPSFIYDSHSNNGLQVGPDGRLYMTLGGTASFGQETHPLAGSILVSNPDGSNLEVFARGLRNPYDLTFTSRGQLIASDNGPERTGDQDELNLIELGQNYGYPVVFGFPPPWSESTGPIAVFPRHSVPTGTIEYQGSNFPAVYRDQIFLSLFGSPGLTSKVVSVTLDEPKPGIFRGTVDDFVTGLRSGIDVTVDSKGRLYIADFDGRQVYQVTWEGP